MLNKSTPTRGMEKIIIEGRPIAWARAGISKKRFFDRQSKERQSFQWKLKSAFNKGPTKAPISLSCVFSFALPKSSSKAKRKALLGTFHVGRPDVDNLAKFVNDAAQGILWGDDSQVVLLTVEKVWAEEDKTTICFKEAI